MYLLKDESNIAVIGNGGAGAECIKTLRESGYSGEIHLFTSSKWPIYNPMLTTYYVAGKISFDQLFIYGKGDEFYREHKLDVHPSSPVIALDGEKKVVANQAGFELNYDQCLIASGSSPILPPIEVVDSERIYTMRTVEDALRLKEVLGKKPRKALIIGASLVGIKLMELFYHLGIEVCLADMANHIFPVNAHPECAMLIEERLKQLGIKLRFGAGIEKVEDTPSSIKAYFTGSGESEEADLLLMCIGMRANTGFIDRKQIEVKQGVLVDEQMRTSIAGVYAAGDVAQGKNLLTGAQQVIGLWDNARYQGRTAGRNMAGISERLPGSIPHNITHFMGMDFVGIGDICEYSKMEKKYSDGRFLQLFWKDGLLTGANFLDNYTESGIIKNVLVKGLLQNKSSYGYSLPAVQNLLIRKFFTEVKNT